MTLLGCGRSVSVMGADGIQHAVVFAFEKGSKDLPASSSWEPIVTATNEALRPSQRSALVLGESMADDAETRPAREQLALERAEQVRAALVGRGVDPARIRAVASPVDSMSRRAASIQLLPPGELKEELDPASKEYRSYCPDKPDDAVGL